MTAAARPLPELETVDDGRRAAVLMHPMRLRILQLAGAPASAADIAGRLGQPRQKVNYHVRELARARFLRRAGTRRKRNMIEQRYVATARAYVIDPGVLGPLGADPRQMSDALSAGYLMGLASLAQAEVAQASRDAAAQKKRLSTLGIHSELRFESAAQRAEFTRALEAAVLDVVATHASPSRLPDGRPGSGRPYRLVAGCYPIPPRSEAPRVTTHTPEDA
ncbi:MAG: helix-turn-helix domain-containing protein [Gemmatimonadaceae bacterium]